MNQSPIEPTPDKSLPEPVMAELLSRYGPTPSIPSSVDAAIRENAYRHLKSRQASIAAPEGPNRSARSARWRWVAGSVSTAAAVVLLVLMWPQNTIRNHDIRESLADVADTEVDSGTESASAGRTLNLFQTERISIEADIDRNGQIDILDAFALARRIESGDSRPDGADINHDGQLNQKDVDLIAMNAVTL